MASEEHHVVNILVAMSSDQENDGPNANNSNSSSDSKFAKKAVVNTTKAVVNTPVVASMAPTVVVAKATEKVAATAKTDVDRRILATLSKLPNDSSNTNRAAPAPNHQSFLGLSWERGYQSLKRFKETHGHTNVPYRYEVDKSLGTWAARQRKEKDNLAPVQIQLLEKLSFSWESAQDRVWLEKFQRLKSFVLQNGNSQVPTSFSSDPELGEWTAKQRQKYTQGRLSSERQTLLNSVGFVYRINKFIKRKSTAREDKKWWEQLERLVQFLLEHGHTLVPFQYVADKSLGRWVNEQRCQNMRGLLRDDRKELLVNIGFIWKVASRKGELQLQEGADAQARWAYFFRQLVEYKNEHRNFNVPTTGDKADLGAWALEQKKLLQTAGMVDEMMAQRFAAIGFCTVGEEKLFEKNYQDLMKAGYTSIYTLANPCLSHWVICQRYLYKKGTLSKERKMKFFEINGFTWDSSPLNLPKPEPKHILKARKRAQQAEPTKPAAKKKQKVAAVASKVNPADDDTASESEGEDSLLLV